ncbi:2-keto-4-pentenoate hydratase (plasmid) [Bombilactobacillus folatiphilus]|uniref:2-keto-4-pentenoate hydratase n=1 Tax=Bombilactobacillus folatiphilus TaxID=2923362 RepID=A0ABY4P764_9LACO|nr:2-keto-4-pentenoate hydratase [Bombilactobacillus folatiphilus]UQS81430.1 2-keto-4-pentenoate hydratase [Bombilactobacillus folatiphilus]UQS82837.1 2-keto-4-pentenoate hydratase [Bombilactobacillus folatiphilus]UQS82943.1 2-keto-4-pentenoate hydratase [Bombilactobacillus folatiphilus]
MTDFNDLTDDQMSLAENLYQAYENHQPLDQAKYAKVLDDEDTAYQVQQYLMQLKNEPIGGYKVSLTSEETQKMFDSQNPLYGVQVVSHFVPSPSHFRTSQLMDPLAEVELMFTATQDLQPNDSLEDLMRKTTIAPDIEVPDSRFSDWFPDLSKYLVVADAAVGGYVVYGRQVPTTQAFASVDAVTQVTCELLHDGQTLKTGAATEVLSNPLLSLQWLVQKLAAQGVQFLAGQRVSSGTFLLPERVTTGQWQAEFNHDLGDVELTVQ